MKLERITQDCAEMCINQRFLDSDAIERQLAHEEKNAVRAAYNRAEYKAECHRLMQWWSDYLRERYK